MHGGFSSLKIMVFTACALMSAGCTELVPMVSSLTGSGPSHSLEVHSQTAIKLDQDNFVTVRTNLVGRSKGFKLLGFITLHPATLDKAMNRLYHRAEAEPGKPQTLANLMIERSGSYFILFSIPVVTARADLVEFHPALAPRRNQPPPTAASPEER